jgi:hypothetical protein
MTFWRMRIACWIPTATDTHSEYGNIYSVFTAAMAAQTRLNVTSTYIAFLLAEVEHGSPGFRAHRTVATLQSYETIHMLHSDLNDAAMFKKNFQLG